MKFENLYFWMNQSFLVTLMSVSIFKWHCYLFSFLNKRKKINTFMCLYVYVLCIIYIELFFKVLFNWRTPCIVTYVGSKGLKNISKTKTVCGMTLSCRIFDFSNCRRNGIGNLVNGSRTWMKSFLFLSTNFNGECFLMEL